MFNNEERNRFYPVYKESEDKIIGFIHSKEIEQLAEFKSDVEDFLIESYYVPESTQLFAQLKNFQKNGTEVALVVDEYGEVTGLITLEDLIEQIIGQFNEGVNVVHGQVPVKVTLGLGSDLLPQCLGSEIGPLYTVCGSERRGLGGFLRLVSGPLLVDLIWNCAGG